MQARHLTPAALGAFVGPALTKVQRTAATAHGGQDMSVAVTFLIHNYGPVFSEHGTFNPGYLGTQPLQSAAHTRQGASGGKRLIQHVDKRGSLPRQGSHGPRVNLLKSVQSPGSQRQALPVAARRSAHAAVHRQQLHAAGMVHVDGSMEVRNAATVVYQAHSASSEISHCVYTSIRLHRLPDIPC